MLNTKHNARRYHKGGSAPDSELSASQLRSRYGVAANKKDFSTGNSGSDANTMMMVGVAAVVGLLVFYFVFF